LLQSPLPWSVEHCEGVDEEGECCTASGNETCFSLDDWPRAQG
jgi:hypothetical protein